LTRYRMDVRMKKHHFRNVVEHLWPAMRYTICLLTNLMFAAHCFLGCCAHHVHAHEGSCQLVLCGEHDDCGHDHHAAPGTPADHDCPSKPCHGGCCIYVKSEMTNADRGMQLISGMAQAADSLYHPAIEEAQANVVEASPPLISQHLYVLNCALLL
jgi:hypothetical protein